MLYQTIAKMGAFAPYIRANNAQQATEKLIEFQRIMRNADIVCSIILSGKTFPDYHPQDNGENFGAVCSERQEYIEWQKRIVKNLEDIKNDTLENETEKQNERIAAKARKTISAIYG